MTTSGDLAALLGGTRERVRTARASVSDWTEPDVWLEALRKGPWAETVGNDPGALGLPDKPTTLTSRQWLDRGAVTEHESADALRTADLVRRQTQHVGAKRGHVEPDPPRRLNCVGMEKPAGFVDDL